VGISPIQYRTWKGDRTALNLRMYVILRSVFKHALKSTGVKILLILSLLFVYAFQFILVLLEPHERLEASDMSSYFNGMGLAGFGMLLTAVVTSDLISGDLSGNSFVLYFSRAIRTVDYAIGKMGGALLVVGILCFAAPVLLAIVAIATQSGPDYLYSATVLGRTVVAGILATLFFVPYGTMLSSFTKRKSYAAVGTFMSFFVLMIIGNVFADFDDAWKIISPADSLSSAFDWLYGQELESWVNEGALAAFLALFMVVPTLILYLRLRMQAVGK
jgi:ABC-type transport system involved in multi-copper enzyme maturation permease subunit